LRFFSVLPIGSPSPVADFLQEVEMAEGVAGLGVRRVLEQTRDVGKPSMSATRAK